MNFRWMNALSLFDPYPMPRLEDLIKHLCKASYITTLDLCKDYWQVPLSKEALCKDPVLQSPDFKLSFTVSTDASGVGLGAVLLQGEGNDQKPVVYISRKLFPRETRYVAVELECLVVKWALDTLKYYLLGRDFSLETDRCALQWLGCVKDSKAQITCWFLPLYGEVPSGPAEHFGRLPVLPLGGQDYREGGKCEKVNGSLLPFLTFSCNVSICDLP